jgi:trk system potassium uptake protein TrkH
MFKKDMRMKLSAESKKEMITSLVVIFLFPVIAFAAASHLVNVVDGVTFENAFFEATGIITTGGLSANVITIDTDPATKMVMGFLMIFGRLEIIAILYIFLPKLAE